LPPAVASRPCWSTFGLERKNAPPRDHVLGGLRSSVASRCCFPLLPPAVASRCCLPLLPPTVASRCYLPLLPPAVVYRCCLPLLPPAVASRRCLPLLPPAVASRCCLPLLPPFSKQSSAVASRWIVTILYYTCIYTFAVWLDVNIKGGN
jgi:hypothetical protein